jgi:hypothetical protein
MKTTTTKKQRATTPGFAIVIEDDTPLDGILMQELAIEGCSLPYTVPVAAVVSVNEAREIAASRKNTETCKYRLWARGLEGEYHAVPTKILVVDK